MKRAVPAGAWDCHAHVFGDPDLYPLAPGRDYDPPPATLEAYLAMLDRHGLARGLLVQPSAYGFDNRCLLDALDRGEGRLLAVAVPAPDTTTEEFEAMHRRGVRGVRCNLLNSGGLTLEALDSWQPALADLGWHVSLHLDIGSVADLDDLLGRFKVPVVIDHMGRPRPGHADPAFPGLRRLLSLVASGACFVKLSAPYRLSTAPPPWRDVMPLAQAFLEANASACVWASDWPHVDTAGPVHVSDLLDAFDECCPSPEAQREVMVRAPGRMLGMAR